jgi:uncharacterized protein (DUF362 family)
VAHDASLVSIQPATRRALVAGAAAAALSGCSRKPAPGQEPAVSILRAPAYDQNVYELVRRLVALHGLDLRGKRVLLKPNLVDYDPQAPINTHPLVVHAALEAFRAAGASDVRIGEGPANRRDTLELAEAAGYFATIPEFEKSFVDLNFDDVERVELSRPVSNLAGLYLPLTVLRSDLLISLPKMKTHRWAGVTLSMKNWFGLVPGAIYGWPKNRLHWAGIDACVTDLHRLFPRAFAIVDAIDAMEGNGPIQGTLRHVGALVAGADLPAVDSTCCRIMGIEPGRIGYIRETSDRGQSVESNVRQVGEAIASVRTRFAVIPEFRRILL